MSTELNAQRGTIGIGIATYRRPALLRELLESLSSADGMNGVTVYIIDNDPEGSGREVANAEYSFKLDYKVEPAPGIAAARNCFVGLSAHEDFLIFVDDDEFVDKQWLPNLRSAQVKFDADVVWGPVIPVFPPTAPAWAVHGGFFERARYATGTELPLAATNNVLVRRSSLDSLENPKFNESFSETGGSDSDLFHRMHRNGSSIRWCDEAMVSEHVPLGRMTWEWVRQRAERTGNVRARLLLSERKILRILLEGSSRYALGSVRLGICKLRRRVPTARELNTQRRGIGMLRALRGRYVREYKRDADADA